MELREYQKRVLNQFSEFLTALRQQSEKFNKLRDLEPDLAGEFHYPRKAWEQIGLKGYQPVSNGLGDPVADVYFKIPTGGGKTLLACHALEKVNRILLQKQTGMVLWVVPTTEIYRQTLKALKDKSHPYRQVLEVASGGRTKIYEKLQNFDSADVENNLCILLLMLPSAARQSKDVLRLFKDNSGYTSFFPDEDDFDAQERLLEETPNLDTYGENGYIFDKLALSSLGNVLRLLRPVTIIDEGHKAYSENARSTILGFNPSFVIELSATPPKDANKIGEVSGRELNDEQMIKLDLHLTNKNSSGWRETLADSVAKRDFLEREALEYQQNTNVYIRPITLIQVERTGKDKRDGKFIHAEDVVECLSVQHGIPQSQIAVKSSDRDDIEGVDLLAQDCEIRYVVTKQALQEGWDCPFAYVLCVLTKAQSEVAMTQLIGRILRQPYARKTGVQSLDESYLYSFQHNTSKLVAGIKKNLENEGLGDIVGRIAVDADDQANPDFEPSINAAIREEFRSSRKKYLLPVFAVRDGQSVRELSYTQDVLSKLDWSELDLSQLEDISLSQEVVDDDLRSIGFDGDYLAPKSSTQISYKSELNPEQMTRQLLDVIPNPWVAYDVAVKAFSMLENRFDVESVASNLVFIIEELRKIIFMQRDLLAEKVFKRELASGNFVFCLMKGNSNSRIPSSASYRSRRRLTKNDGSQLAKSLFDYVPAESVNGFEQDVAAHLDEQMKLLWWYRNVSQSDFRIQGWRSNRVYPDFIAMEETPIGGSSLYVLETKGGQLAGNQDTQYKRSLLDFCNSLAVSKDWAELDFLEDADNFHFEMIDEMSWRQQLNQLFA